MTFQRTAATFCHHALTARRPSSRTSLNLLFSGWVRWFGIVAVAMMLLAGCGDDDYDEPLDDFLVSFPSDLEIFIRRSSDGPFDLLEIGVTPFVDPDTGTEPYVLDILGIAFSDGFEISFVRPERITPAVFVDPLGERVVNTSIVCNCFVDYVVLRSPYLDLTITFD